MLRLIKYENSNTTFLTNEMNCLFQYGGSMSDKKNECECQLMAVD